MYRWSNGATVFYALGVVLAWSLGSFGSSRVSRAWGAGVTNRVRLAIALGILGAASLLMLGFNHPPDWAKLFWPERVTWHAMVLYVLAGATHMGMGDLFLFASYRAIGPRLGVLICLCSSAPMALGLEWVVLGHLPPWWDILLGAVVLASVIVALAPKERLRIGGRAIVTGAALGLSAGFCQAMARTMERYVESGFQWEVPATGPVLGTAARMLGGLLICLVIWGFAVWFRVKDVSSDYDSSLDRNEETAKQRVWLWLMVSVIMGPVVGVQLLHLATSTTPGAIVQATLCLLPMSIIPVAWLLDGDKPSLRSVLGGVVAVGAVIGMALI